MDQNFLVFSFFRMLWLGLVSVAVHLNVVVVDPVAVAADVTLAVVVAPAAFAAESSTMMVLVVLVDLFSSSIEIISSAPYRKSLTDGAIEMSYFCGALNGKRQDQ